ncbi:MAG: methylmalonyl-CoA carboxyltransferase [Spirochaetales bacterium]|nr:MAG: methylmalonyl-CoA carboxyltransferase [Spirochaetales bacterium]
MSLDKLEELRQKKQGLLAGGGEERLAKQRSKGKMTARERITLLFDEGSFVELDAFVSHRSTYFGMDKVSTPAEGVITGYGKVDGRLVYAYSQDFTVLGGSLGEMHAAKICKVMDAAIKVGAPMVGFNDSGGARIQEGIDALKGYGDIFFRNTRASGVIPQIVAVMGPCAGGAVYSPAIADFIFMVDKTSQMFITGPQVIKTVTGEEVSAESLGGATTHNTTSGVAQFMAGDDASCIAEIRRLLGFLPSNNMETAPEVPTSDSLNAADPQLNTLVPENANKPYDMFDVIRAVADNGDYMEYQALYARNMITAFTRINGRTVGIVANQPMVLAGCLDINASDKSARFIRMCDTFNIPVLTLVDTPGFLPGTGQEFGGIIRHGAKLLYAYSEATVPLVTLITRKAYGGAYIAMGSRHLGADVVLAWPSAEVAVMGPKGAANIVFRKEIKNAEDPETAQARLIADYEKEFATPYKAAERGYVDDIIEPAVTRSRLADALDMLASKQGSRPPKKHGNIPL